MGTARKGRKAMLTPAAAATTLVNGVPYATHTLPTTSNGTVAAATTALMGGPGGFVAHPAQPLPATPAAAPATPANVNAAVAAALQAVATGKVPTTAAQGGSKAQRWAALVAANAALTLLPNKRALTGQAHGGTAPCYAAATALAQAGQLTAANIQAACANLKVPNPKWPAYALGTWLVPANQ